MSNEALDGEPSAVKEKSLSSRAAEENYLEHRAADNACWSSFLSIALMVFGFAIASIWSLWNVPPTGIRMYSLEYFILCTIGGIFSGLPHTLLTPIDMMKCRVQCGEFASASEGYRHLWGETAKDGWIGRISAFCRGWAPTFIGYSIQGAMKFGLYEYFKYFYAGILGPQAAINNRFMLFITASATAEVFADFGLAPWEAIKIKMQTTRTFPPLISVVVPRVWAIEGWAGFYKGLPPLWSRQVPYTMVKFASFEKIVEFTYTVIVAAPKSTLPPVVQLAISVVSGFAAGMLCAFVSHPSDSVVSKVNQKNDARYGFAAAVRDLGCSGLWRGLLFRMMFIGSITAMQWLIYDSFKVVVGLPTTGGGAPSPVMILNRSSPAK